MSQAKTNSLPLLTGCLHPGMRLGVAVSGGADSVALLRVLARRRQELGLVLTALHVHHGIRGAEADGDALFAEGLAQDLGVRFLRNDVNTPERAQKAGESIEEAARNLRYAWFDELLGQGELDAVATAHSLDDQAETVLLKLLRGAWTRGLAGIYPLVELGQGKLVRPLLGERRQALREYLQSLSQVWREDRSNADCSFTRNRIRHELLPLLERDFQPGIAALLGATAELARGEQQFWDEHAAHCWRQCAGERHVVPDGMSWGFDLPRFRQLQVSEQRRAVEFGLRDFVPLDFRHLEAARLAILGGSSSTSLPASFGLSMAENGTQLVLRQCAAPPEP